MSPIAQAVQACRQHIEAALKAYGRAPGETALLAVSKTFAPETIREAYAAGQRAFGENYLQEALPKIAALADLPGLEWHFIGPLQSNKTKPVAEHFAWVHAVDRLKIAERLSAQRPVGLPALSVCVQVNISGEASKSGVAPAQALPLALAVARLPRLHWRGFMGIAEPCEDPARQHAQFAILRELGAEARRLGLTPDTLSMGMSADLEAAIAQGSTLVRVGTAIFGHRSVAPPKEGCAA
ncbi:Pyridoxal phosphate homeostasis protein [Burkholderiales bacterium]|nr:MAG: YggS family pyridoxal phosphate-dependent enzyme [Burkholderiales bacterium]CAG0957655.1 Pyridoxal phosphate homeostasis protein [Burkholderiales bacterium]